MIIHLQTGNFSIYGVIGKYDTFPGKKWKTLEREIVCDYRAAYRLWTHYFDHSIYDNTIIC